MKTLMVMFDSLNRHMLEPYGCNWVQTPNFARLSRRAVTFETSYVCSMPCMPARRDLHTGRPNFLHRSWGPLEPFDESLPAILSASGVYTHLSTDHYHYFEDGGATYHNRYNSYEFFRGQEGDAWKGQVRPPAVPPSLARNAATDRYPRQDWVNRQFITTEEAQPQAQTFAAGLDFLRRNGRDDRWFLQIETFDPHEPFFSLRPWKDRYAEHYDRYRAAGGKHFDWPHYRHVTEQPEEVEHARFEYASLVTMCDAYLGHILDTMDQQHLWDDTMLIVWTDHGFLLGEHDCWAKVWMPFYEQVAHTPFFIWDPRCKAAGERRRSLVQPSIDLAPTILDFHGLPAGQHMIGCNLRDTIRNDAPVRSSGIFGLHGGQLNITDGRHVYMRAPANSDNQPLFDYTLMPTHMRQPFSVEELRPATLAAPFSFTDGCPLLKLPARRALQHPDLSRNLLWDVQADPQQLSPITRPEIESQLVQELAAHMARCDAPPEQFTRLGLSLPPTN